MCIKFVVGPVDRAGWAPRWDATGDWGLGRMVDNRALRGRVESGRSVTPGAVVLDAHAPWDGLLSGGIATSVAANGAWAIVGSGRKRRSERKCLMGRRENWNLASVKRLVCSSTSYGHREACRIVHGRGPSPKRGRRRGISVSAWVGHCNDRRARENDENDGCSKLLECRSSVEDVVDVA